MARIQGYESGSSSIVGYIVVGILLAIIVVGGVFVVKHQLPSWFGGNAEGQAVAVNDDDNKSSTEGEPPFVSSIDGGQSDAGTNNANSDQSTSNGADSESATGNGVVKDSHAPAGGSDTQTSSKLPATGPTELFRSMVAVAALTAAGVYYFASKRSQFSL